MPEVTTRDRRQAEKIFPETQWNLLRSARQPDKEGAAAVEMLCRQYWHPVYFHLRSRGCSTHDAEDLTQSFFQKQLGKGIFHAADPGRGSLRSLVLIMVDRFLIDGYRASRALKRGGGAVPLSLEADGTDQPGIRLPTDTRDPETIHLSGWVRGMIERCRERLRTNCRESSWAERSAALDPYFDPDAGPAPYAALALRFGVNENTLHLHLRRLRQKLAALLRDDVARTVDSPEELRDELRWFVTALQSN